MACPGHPRRSRLNLLVPAIAAIRIVAATSVVCGSEPVRPLALEVPGGLTPVAMILNLDPHAARPVLALAVIRALHERQDGLEPDRLERLAAARVYLEAAAVLRRATRILGTTPATAATMVDRLPKPVCESLARTLGLQIGHARDRSPIRLEPDPEATRIRARLRRAGVDPETWVQHWEEGRAVDLRLPVDDIPALFPATVWQAWWPMSAPDPDGLAAHIFLNRQSALTYYGAAGIDPATRLAFAQALPDWGDADIRLHGVFALTGRSLRIVEGRVQVPGGADYVGAWEALVGAKVNDPVAFVPRLFGQDRGQLAALYDGMAHLEPGMLALALGGPQASTKTRTAALILVQDTMRQVLAGWDPGALPFERTIFDPMHLLLRLQLSPDGRHLRGPLSRRFWEAAFTDLDNLGASGLPKDLTGRETVDPVDAVTLVGVQQIGVRRDRAEAWLFAQRVFPEPGSDMLPDVLVAVRGHQTYRVVVLTLERMGVTEPAVYAAAVRMADRVTRYSGVEPLAVLQQFQGALAVVERGRHARAFDVPTATGLVRSLTALPIGVRGFEGGLAAWFDREIFPRAVRAREPRFGLGADTPDETRLLAVLSGALGDTPEGAPERLPVVEWEGLRYRVDVAAADLQRFAEVRARQGGMSLDVVLEVFRAARALRQPGQSGGGPAGARLRAALVAAAHAARVAPGLEPGEATGDVDWLDLEERVSDLAARPEMSRVAAVVSAVYQVAERALGCQLASLAYLPHLGPADSPALLDGDPSRFHDYGLAQSRIELRRPIVWRLPREIREPGRRWHLAGPLLALDTALGGFALRRVPGDTMPDAPALTDVERAALTQAATLVSPFAYRDDARRALVLAYRAGRARLAAEPERLLSLAEEVGIDEWRLQTFAWLAAREPERIDDLWSAAELVRLGLGPGQTLPDLDPWGGSDASVDGALICRFPWRQPWTSMSGRTSAGGAAALVPDLAIVTADALDALGLPARLSSGILAVATQQLFDTVRVAHDDDWLTLVHAARHVADGRIEDFVAALTVGGALVPLDAE